MEMFNVKRRDIVNFKDFTKANEKVLETPTFEDWKKDKDSVLRKYLGTIERAPIFSHDAFDSTYKMLDKSR